MSTARRSSVRLARSWLTWAWPAGEWPARAPLASERPARTWWSGLRPPVRDAAIAAAATIVIVVAAYGEAHPTDPGRYFTGAHHLPHTPNAAFLLIIEFLRPGAPPCNGSSGNGPGHGLRGMCERAAAAGTIEIGAPPAGGFRVAARFPLDSAAPIAVPHEAAR